MDKKKIRSTIKNALNNENAIIQNIYPAAEGMTNFSYFATINGEKFIVRIPGRGTAELINRREEKENLLFGTALGLNPEHVYFNDETGMKITKKIDSATTLTPKIAREGQTIIQIIALMKHLHHSKSVMQNRFELFDLMSHYEQLVGQVNPLIIEKLAPIKQDVADLKGIYQSLQLKESPCHIDTVCSNIVISRKDELFLIDWEYSGMFDPLWDVATLFVSLELGDEEKLFFLMHYLGREPSEAEQQRILMHNIFQDYLWSLWSFYKESKGDNFGADGMKRYERALSNVSLFKKLYEDDIVV